MAAPGRTAEGHYLSTSAMVPRSGRHDPFEALRQRNFLLFTGSRVLSGTGTALLQAVIAWQVYALTGSALSLGLLGVVRFVPALAATLIGGAAADMYDRRLLVIGSQLPPLAVSAVLFVATTGGWVSTPVIYALVLVIALAAAFENPARQSLLPLVVRPESFLNAVATTFTFQQLAFTAGPALAGLVIAQFGVDRAYAVHVVLIGGSLVLMALVRARRETTPRRAVSIAEITAGVRFVRRRPVLLGAMALDMFAVIFGGANALLPIYAEDILKVGARGYGLLTSSQSVGALLVSVVLVALPPVKRTGLVLLLAVAAFGLATVLFGVARSFPVALVAYGLTGVADQVSVIMRQTTIQLATPDELRGRVSAVGSLFISASNQVGMIESGLVAAVTSATFAVVSGGLGCLAVVGIIAARIPELRRHRIDEPATG